MELLIREATVGDAEGLGVVHVAAWQSAYPGLISADYLATLDPVARGDRWRRILEAGGAPTTTLVALVGGRVAGFTSYGPPNDEVPDGWGQLWAINLHPDFWRQGIGTALFSQTLDRLAGLGYHHGYLWVLDGNERAIAFYRRQGWPPDGTITTDDQFGGRVTELRCSSALRPEGA